NVIQTVQAGLRESYECLASVPIFGMYKLVNVADSMDAEELSTNIAAKTEVAGSLMLQSLLYCSLVTL
ncbi:hypothetical protein Tco_1358313, partial [Tanacetum coccineum]